jgi:hypothetical protein
MKVLTFSKVFPKSHINAGEPTVFKGKILSGEKIHTIRPETNKWKIGDQISMRYWEGKPYHSKQEIFCEKFEVVELVDMNMCITENKIDFLFSNCLETILNKEFKKELFTKIANNDGLTFEQFESWFTINDRKCVKRSYDLTLIAWQPTNY